MWKIIKNSIRYIRFSHDDRFDIEINPYGQECVILPRPITKRRVNGKRIIIGRLVDPYGPYELEYKNTLATMSRLISMDIDLCIMTGSLRVFRDIGILKSFKITPTICVPIRYDSNSTVIRARKGTATSDERVEVLKRAKEEGFKTICRVGPLYPMFSDPITIISKVKNYADEIWVENFYGMPEHDKYFRKRLGVIVHVHPEAKDLYRRIYYDEDDTYWIETWKNVYKYCVKHGIKNKVHNYMHMRFPVYFQ